MRSSTRQKMRRVHGPLDSRQEESLAAAPDQAKTFAAALLSATPEQAPAGWDANKWVEAQHREGARIGVVLASGTLEPGFPKTTGFGTRTDPRYEFVWSSNGARVPPYQPSANEILGFATDWHVYLGRFYIPGWGEANIQSWLSGDLSFADQANEYDGVLTVSAEYVKEMAEAAKAALPGLPSLPDLPDFKKYTKWLPTALGALGTAALRIGFPILPQVVSLAPFAIGVGVQVVNAVEEAKAKVTP